MINHDNPSILDFSECGISLKDLMVLSMMSKNIDDDYITALSGCGYGEDEIKDKKRFLAEKIKSLYNVAEIALISRKEHILESNKKEHSK